MPLLSKPDPARSLVDTRLSGPGGHEARVKADRLLEARFWVPSLLVAPFTRWARRRWSVPPTVLRETLRLVRLAAVRPALRRAAGRPGVRSGRGLPARQQVAQ